MTLAKHSQVMSSAIYSEFCRPITLSLIPSTAQWPWRHFLLHNRFLLPHASMSWFTHDTKKSPLKMMWNLCGWVHQRRRAAWEEPLFFGKNPSKQTIKIWLTGANETYRYKSWPLFVRWPHLFQSPHISFNNINTYEKDQKSGVSCETSRPGYERCLRAFFLAHIGRHRFSRRCVGIKLKGSLLTFAQGRPQKRTLGGQ